MKIGNLEVYGVIYKITNKVNGKVYIGQTTEKRGFNGRYKCAGEGIERVYKHHKSNKNCKNKKANYNDHLFKSIEKYGFEAFDVCEIFDTAFSKDELNFREKSWISIYKSNIPKCGYNGNDGGENSKPNQETKNKISKSNTGKKMSSEAKKKMSEAKKGKPSWNKGIPMSEEHIKRLRDINIGNKYSLGRKLSEETKAKISKAKKGENHPMYGKHLSEETKSKISISNTGKTCSEETKAKISKAKKGEKNHNYGKHFSEEIKKKMSNSQINDKNKSKQVYQYNENLDLINIYLSTMDVERKTGFIHTCISACCNNKYGKNKNIYKGYIWSYEPLN